MDNLMSGLGFSRKKSFDDDSEVTEPNTEKKKTVEPDDDFDVPDDTMIAPPIAEMEEYPEEQENIGGMPVTAETPSKTTRTHNEAARQPLGIGPKIFIRGEVIGEEDLIIQGKVEGSVDLSGHHLTIGINGAVIANIKAKVITIEGNVAGDVSAEELIEIKASSQVKGNLICERVILEDGARFRGSIDMSIDDLAEELPFKAKAKADATA